MNTAALQIHHQPDRQCFECHVEGLRSELDYRLDPDNRRVVFSHTGVPAALQGRGIAAALVQAGLDWARREQLRVIPACSYVAVYMRRHPETQDLLAG